MKKILSIIIAAALILAQVPAVFADEAAGAGNRTESAGHLAFYYEDEPLDLPAYLVGGEIYVPVRAIAGLIGFETNFHEGEKAVVLSWIGERQTDYGVDFATFVKVENRRVTPSSHRLYAGSFLSADFVEIDGYNFVSLEDAGQLLGYMILEDGEGNVILAEDGHYAMSEAEQQAYRDYLTANTAVVDTTGAATLDKTLFEGYDVYFVGENHAVSMNNDVHLFFIKYLNENFGVRYILRESGFVDTMKENRYLKTGDPAIIDAIVSGNRGSSVYTKETYAFMEALYEYNKTLPEDRKLYLLGIDVQHNIDGGVEYILELMEQLENKPEQVQKDLDALKAVENRESFYAFVNSVKANQEVYQECMGEDYLTLKYSLESVRQAMEYYSVSDFEIREGFIHENFSNMTADYRADKLFGMFGGAHTILDGDMGNLPNLARYINEQVPQMKGKVLSILIDYNNCYNMSSMTGEPQLVQSTWSRKISGLMADVRPEEKLVMFPVRGESSPFPDNFRESFQFYLSMRNSAAATPYGPLGNM